MAKTAREVAQTTFGEMMEEIIDPQVHTAMLRNPNITQSDSVKLERAKLRRGTVREANIIKK